MKLLPSFLRSSLLSSTRFFYGPSLQPYSLETIQECPLIAKKLEYTISINSKNILPSDIFLAHKGNKVDSHNFLVEALENNASGLLISHDNEYRLKTIDPNLLNDRIIISVPDTLKALVELAKVWRSYFSYPVVGVTGSLGKTTTKEMIRSIFAASGKSIFVNYKSYNSIIGLPISILSMNDTHEGAVFEVGVNAQGEMQELVDILKPTIALITALSHMHTAGLGSLSEVAHEKKLLFSTLGTEGIGIIPGDYPLLSQASYSHPIIRFGKKTKNQIQARKIVHHHHPFDAEKQSFGYITFILKLYDVKIPITLHTESDAMVLNALAASSVCHLFSVNPLHIAQGLSVFRPIVGRFKKEILPQSNTIIINDCYNAGPDSMKNALTSFNRIPFEGKRIVVLGEMRELGSKEHYWHRKIGRELCKLKSLDHLLLIGEKAKSIAKTAPLTIQSLWFPTWQEAYLYFQTIPLENSIVLVKGSLGVGLLNFVDKVIEWKTRH